MRKFFLTLAIMALMAGQALAGPDAVNIIDAVTLDDDPTSTTGTRGIADYERVAFFVDYDETEVGNSVSIAITVDISYDATNWLDAKFYDVAGGATLQTTETLTADGWYYCWLDPDMHAPYVRLAIAATSTDADDTALIEGYIVGLR